jgi:hypothetical protein
LRLSWEQGQCICQSPVCIFFLCYKASLTLLFRYAASFEARCLQMDALCTKLEIVSERLSRSIETLNSAGRMQPPVTRNDGDVSTAGGCTDVQSSGQAAHQTHLEHPDPHRCSKEQDDSTEGTDHYEVGNQIADEPDPDSDSDQDSEDLDGEHANTAGSLVKDSYGSFRFVGGVTNAMLIEAIQELSPDSAMTAPTPDTPAIQGSKRAELPFFLPGVVWPELPFLPKLEQLPRPPQYVADLLIGLYFDRIHYTFPIVYKPSFMTRYRQVYRGSSHGDIRDRRFMIVFFAVCACASSLLPSSSGTQLAGNEYYEKALLLYYASAGEASLARVQCLGLLALCTAGWNILAQSWMLAGQAVRAAMDIGLHLDTQLVSHPYCGGCPYTYALLQRSTKTDCEVKRKPSHSQTELSDSHDLLLQHLSRRVWWSVYTLDR